jgi:hypothetical protein
LEVNHWSHEKVTYRGTDGRTSAPLALVRTSWGRCGEESTFTATALRAVGIPARQCYTPRWAHTDDNHAWVEVWIDGQWHYLGACEPEPELNRAWFTGAAQRAMMVHTNVFGLYNGPEEKNLETNLYSKINLLANYAPTRQVKVKIIDEQNQPVDGAKVKFKIYNYAELYPIAETFSDEDGTSAIISGLGDIMIWANKGDVFGYEKASPGTELVTVKLNRRPGTIYNETYTMEVPKEQAIKEADAEKTAQNTVRLAYEDSIRTAYMNTFATEKEASDLAHPCNLDEKNVWKYLQLAQGNWQEISHFIQQRKENVYLFPFLNSLLEKDLRDTPADVLFDHLPVEKETALHPGTSETFIASEILSPRIALELIQPWRTFFQQEIKDGRIPVNPNQIQEIIRYVEQEIQLREEENYYNCCITPRGTYELKVSDKRSRDVFFVALCRSLGMAARIEKATGKLQYYADAQWKDVVFETNAVNKTQAKGSLVLTNDKHNLVKPGYYSHFTIAKFVAGDFVTLDFEDDATLNHFPCKLSLDEGYYRLMMGSRANDGSVTIRTEYFEIKKNQTQTQTIALPETIGKIQVLGIVDMNTILLLDEKTKTTLKALSAGKGLIICFADPDKEPTKHILQEIPALKTELEEWGGGLLFLIPDDKSSPGFDVSAFKNLPEQTVWSIDNQRAMLKNITAALRIDFQNNFPLIMYLSRNGGILYLSEGYKIGIGNEWMRVIKTEYGYNDDF